MLPAANDGEAPDAAGQASDASACNAAAPTASPASPPTRRSASLSDLLVQNGGTAILSETPEIYGAEHMLLRRAVSKEVGEKLLELLKWWEDYTATSMARASTATPRPATRPAA